MHGNFVRKTPSGKNVLNALRHKHHQTFYDMLEKKFIELEKTDVKANHKLAAEDANFLPPRGQIVAPGRKEMKNASTCLICSSLSCGRELI
jgi:hypothetical protein